jgi:hypothetical protein
MSLLDIKNDPNYVNANAATKQAIFDQYSTDDKDYTSANAATQAAIRAEFGLATETTTNAQADLTPQALSVVKQVGAIVPEGMRNVAPAVRQGAQFVANRPLITTLADIGGVASAGVPLGTTLNAAKSAVMGGGPTLAETYAGVKKLLSQGGGALASGARNLGGAVVSGVTAPESLLAMPYQMAAYEQEKIRANPNAPEYATNPYAQMYRGEAATQGQAGAANRRNAIARQQYGGLSPQEQAILQQDAIDREIRLKAAQLALRPVPPTPQPQQ